MSWRQFVRSIEADARRRGREANRQAARAEREAVRRHRELQREAREAAKYDEKLQAAHEAARYQNYVEMLVSIHKDCGPWWDWRAITAEYPPPPPQRSDRHEAEARQILDSYNAGLVDKLFGGAKKKIAAMQLAVDLGRSVDQAEFAKAMQVHQDVHAAWVARTALAPRILSGDPTAYTPALELADSFSELLEFQTRVVLTQAQADVAAFDCRIMDDELVPSEEVKLTSTGKLSTKAMPAGRYWALYQDHVCSAALRVAREAFAVLPVSRAIVNIGSIRVNSSNGHREPVTFLALHIARNTLQQINMAQIDPSDSMKNFQHRMKFKKTTGFEAVAPITADEHWVTT